MRRFSRVMTGIGLAVALGALGVSPVAASTVGSEETCAGRVATIVGTDDDDQLIGTPGPDVIVGLHGKDQIQGGPGDDLICGGRHKDRLDGGEGDDTIFGSNADGTFDYGGGDKIEGGPGDDALDGGDGRGDELLYVNATSAVALDFDLDTATGASTGTDSFAGFGVYQGSAYDDTFRGKTAGWVYGGAGNDDIRGPELVFAGAGDDKIVCDDCTSSNGNYYSGPGNDVVRLSGGFNHVLGEEGSDLIVGGTGRDDIDGGEGNDRLLGRDGPDNFVAEGGDDVIRGGADYDGIQLSRATAGVDINLRSGVATGASTGTDSVRSLEEVWGSRFDDVITGVQYANGIPGNDVIRHSVQVDGGDGDDVIVGTRADNDLDGGPGNDVIRDRRGNNILAGASGEDRIIGGTGSDSLNGGTENDILRSGDGSDNLAGGDGDDYLDGGPLDDSGDGGLGTDTCVNLETTVSCELA